MSSLLISPHNDDESLFCAYTLCRESTDIQVVVIFDGYVQATRGEKVTWQERREETVAALKELGVVKPPIFAGFRDNVPDWDQVCEFCRQTKSELQPEIMYIPEYEIGGHAHHNRLHNIGRSMFQSPVLYKTYTIYGKSTSKNPVIPEPDWVIRKLRALACYKSQIHVANCREHFTRGLNEYYA